jgi:hypothetical protein
MTRAVLIGFLAAACGGAAPSAEVAPPPAPVAAAPVAAPAEAPAEAKGPPARGDDSTRRSKNGSASLTVGSAEVQVTFGRPEARGREVWGGLVPYGQLWRTGADEATVVHLTGDVKFGDTPVKAGSYALFTIPEKEQWTFVLNSVAEQWGSYDHDPAKDVAKAVVTPEKAEPAEVFTISADGGALVLQWAELKAKLPLSAM